VGHSLERRREAPGFPVVILGGEHGDVPLEKGAGEIVAKLVVEERVSVLLDLSQFRKARSRRRFMADFLETLYRLKAKEALRTPLMVIIDEADAIAPQKPNRGEERMLGAAEDIVRRGGQRGIGCMMITQRTAVLNKNVLTQCEMLVALRTISPQDLKAMQAWIDVHGSIEERDTLMESLPSLPQGDAWFWSPGWPTKDGIFKRVHVCRSRRSIPARRRSPARSASSRRRSPTSTSGALSGRWRRRSRRRRRTIRRSCARRSRRSRSSSPRRRRSRSRNLSPINARSRPRVAPTTDGDLPPGTQKLLDAAARLLAVNIVTPTRTQVAALAPMSPTSSATERYFAKAIEFGYLEKAEAGEVRLTDAGAAVATPVDVPPTLEDYVAEWQRLLGEGAERKLYDAYVNWPKAPGAIARADLAELAGISSTSSATERGFAWLIGLDLLQKAGTGEVRAGTTMFPEGLE
jgi:hypothetical protein